MRGHALTLTPTLTLTLPLTPHPPQVGDHFGELSLFLPYISPTSPLYLPYISTSPLHLPYISPTSPLSLASGMFILSTAAYGPRMMSSQQMAHASMCSSDGSTPAARAAPSASSLPFSCGGSGV